MTVAHNTLGPLSGEGNQCRFVVWAPNAGTVELLIEQGNRVLPMTPREHGYHEVTAENIAPGTRYRFRLDGRSELPDPASRFQPDGVHGPSQVVKDEFEWQDATWFGLPLRDYVIYELHVGTFTPEGTFDAVIPHLQELKQLGITALELMPVAQFPGERNWGYDGVFPFAVQNSYGGPDGLKRLVDAAHRVGLAVVLDVVYNHLGPEGNYLGQFGPYFTDRYRTPWGSAMNFDDAQSGDVRRYFIQNALRWQTEFHIDALRLDAVHAIYDFSAMTFLEELAEETRRQSERLNRRFYLIAESDLNQPRLILPAVAGGYGLDAQWSDDFHHALHVLLTGEKQGYYADFGGIGALERAFRHGYVYVNEHSEFRKRRHGKSPELTRAKQFVVCSRNHDQIGNRMMGERLDQLTSFEGVKLAAGAVVLSPFIPLLFMGEEYGETAPFQYFTSHADPDLIAAVRKGRAAEFAAFDWQGTPPDPHYPETFQRSKLNRELRREGKHRVLMDYYRELLSLRRTLPAVFEAEKDTLEVFTAPGAEALCVHYWTELDAAFVVFCFAEQPVTREIPLPPGAWIRKLDSSETRWGGLNNAGPVQLDSRGTVNLQLPGRAVLLFHRQNDTPFGHYSRSWSAAASPARLRK